RARWKFRHERAALANARGETGIFRRIDPVEARTEHRHGDPASEQRALMARGVDANGEPARDGETGPREPCGELTRSCASGGSRATAGIGAWRPESRPGAARALRKCAESRLARQK